jgi:hypothetical protein
MKETGKELARIKVTFIHRMKKAEDLIVSIPQ